MGGHHGDVTNTVHCLMDGWTDGQTDTGQINHLKPWLCVKMLTVSVWSWQTDDEGM